MSQALTQSTQNIVNGKPGVPFICKNVHATEESMNWITSPCDGSVTRLENIEKAMHPHYDWSFSSNVAPASNCFTSPTYFEFSIQNTPGFFMEDHDGLWLEINVQNSDGSNTVTPTAVEWFFDEIKAVEYYMDGQLFHTCPAYQTQWVPALEMIDTDYAKLVNLLNHNASIAANSVTAVGTSSSAQYFMRVPNPFAEGFYFGALAKGLLTI